MTREEREQLPPDEQAVFCAAFAASFVLHTHDGSYDARAKWRAGSDAEAAVKAFREEWKS